MQNQHFRTFKLKLPGCKHFFFVNNTIITLISGDDDDSDVDVVTDFLETNEIFSFQSSSLSVDVKSSGLSLLNNENLVTPSGSNTFKRSVDSNYLGTNSSTSNNSNYRSLKSVATNGSSTSSTVIMNLNNVSDGQHSNNMVPIISVTPHSPGAKYSCILGENNFAFNLSKTNVLKS